MTTGGGGREKRPVPHGYLGADGRISSGPAPVLVEAGYVLELADAPLLHTAWAWPTWPMSWSCTRQALSPPDQVAVLLSTLLELLDIPWRSSPTTRSTATPTTVGKRELERRLGSVAGWLHSGRTRREAGRIAFRLALRARLLDLHEAVSRVSRGCRHPVGGPCRLGLGGHHVPAAGATIDIRPLPGRFRRRGDPASRPARAGLPWADRSPAGVGGVGGSRVPMDRTRLARSLGFALPGAHTRDAMWAVDGLADAVVTAAQAATTVDRWPRTWRYSPARASVTSHLTHRWPSLVLMPQKRNPYALAVIRAGAWHLGRQGDWAAGHPSDPRQPAPTTGCTPMARWRRARTGPEGGDFGRRGGADTGGGPGRAGGSSGAELHRRTDLAEELLLRHGLDYRSAYRVVGRAVATAIERGRTSLTEADVSEAGDRAVGKPLRLGRLSVGEADAPFEAPTLARGAGPGADCCRAHRLGRKRTGTGARSLPSPDGTAQPRPRGGGRNAAPTPNSPSCA